jgi:hypothetical protein
MSATITISWWVALILAGGFFLLGYFVRNNNKPQSKW